MININEILEYENGEQSAQDEIALFQRMINDGSVWSMPGTYGRRAMDLLRSRECELGDKPYKDFYGNWIPSRFGCAPGSVGSPLERASE